MQNTSDSVSSDGISAESAATGSLTSVPSSLRDADRLALAAVDAGAPQQPPWGQEVCRPSAQKSQVLSAQANGATTRSPRLSVGDLGADVLDDADELVAHAAALLAAGIDR